jgi:hypothetical protein
MILVKELKTLIYDYKQALASPELKSFFYKNLDKGHCIFLIPERFNENNQMKKSYKIGFIFELLTVIYPSYGKEKKHKIIDENYHLFVNYRQFKNLLDNYEKSRKQYY